MIPDPILDPIYLKDNWADNGEKAISLFTWDKAVSTFRMIEKVYAQERYTQIETPSFSPCPDDSLDIYWDINGKYSLLINVDGDFIDYFGTIKKDNIKSKIKGNYNYPGDVYFLGYWLASVDY